MFKVAKSNPFSFEPKLFFDLIRQDVEGVEETRKMLMKNFDDAYKGKTRAPLGYYVHAAWFFGNENRLSI